MLYVYLCTDYITLDILYPILRHVICLLVYRHHFISCFKTFYIRHVICLLVYRLHNFGHFISYFKTYVYLCTDIITLDILYPILRHVICLLRHVYRHHNFGHFISYFKTCYMSTCVQTS